MISITNFIVYVFTESNFFFSAFQPAKLISFNQGKLKELLNVIFHSMEYFSQFPVTAALKLSGFRNDSHAFIWMSWMNF